MQGMYVTTKKWGPNTRWWAALITSSEVDADDRQAAYKVKKAAKNTHQFVNFSWAYRSDQLLHPFEGQDFSNNLVGFKAIVREVICNGFWPVIMLAGDGLSKDPDGNEIHDDSYRGPFGYNDPKGDTYGYQWLLTNFERIYHSIGPTPEDADDLRPYVCWCPGYDGVVPAWASVEDKWTRQEDWLLFARSIVGPTGVLITEMSAGYWCWSEQNRYASPGGQCLDVTMFESSYPMGPPDPCPADFCNQPNDVRHNWDTTWQISKRMLGPNWKRPDDMPDCDDPGMAPDFGSTPRGPVYRIGLEYDTYGWVRGCPPEQVEKHRAYLYKIGWKWVG